MNRIKSFFTPARKKQLMVIAVYSMVFTVMLAADARADAISSIIDDLVDKLTSIWARGIAVCACAFLGYMAFAGMLTWQKAIMFVVGIALVFGAATVVDTFSSAAG